MQTHKNRLLNRCRPLPRTIVKAIFVAAGLLHYGGVAMAETSTRDLEGTLREVLSAEAKRQGILGIQACLISAEGNETNAAVGFVDKRRKTPIDVQDVFRVGSVTKMYTAVVVHDLAARSVLDLSGTLDRWFPSFPSAASISLRDLLRHRSGIPDVLSLPRLVFASTLLPRRAWSVEEVLNDVAGSRRAGFGVPGAAFAYSNTNYVLLGAIAEKASGRGIRDLFREAIFRPAGLSSTSFLPEQMIPEALRAGFDRSLIPFPWGYRHAPGTTSWASLSFASGAVATNARELALFVHALASGRILERTGLDEMRAFTDCSFPDNPAIDGVGSGLFRFKLNGREYWGHEGLMIGSQSVALHSVERGWTLAVIVNLSRVDIVSVARAIDAMSSERLPQ